MDTHGTNVKYPGFISNASMEDRLFSSREIIYLLKNGFDLFGLIDSGFAIDAKTLEG